MGPNHIQSLPMQFCLSPSMPIWRWLHEFAAFLATGMVTSKPFGLRFLIENFSLFLYFPRHFTINGNSCSSGPCCFFSFRYAWFNMFFIYKRKAEKSFLRWNFVTSNCVWCQLMSLIDWVYQERDCSNKLFLSLSPFMLHDSSDRLNTKLVFSGSFFTGINNYHWNVFNKPLSMISSSKWQGIFFIGTFIMLSFTVVAVHKACNHQVL